MWPTALAKINLHLAGVPAHKAAPAIEAAAAAPPRGAKRKRCEQDDGDAAREAAAAGEANEE